MVYSCRKTSYKLSKYFIVGLEAGIGLAGLAQAANKEPRTNQKEG